MNGRLDSPLVLISWDPVTGRIAMRWDDDPRVTGAVDIADAMLAALSRGVELHIPTSVYETLRGANAIPQDFPDWIKVV